MADVPVLVVFGGRSGVGKTSLAGRIARRLAGVYLRIDTIEQGIRNGGVSEVGRAGYAVAFAVAAENLSLGVSVIADGVQPLQAIRDEWIGVAERFCARVAMVEVSCSDVGEHRRRVEARHADIAGHRVPSWPEVEGRFVEPWGAGTLHLDTAGLSLGEAEECLSKQLEAAGILN